MKKKTSLLFFIAMLFLFLSTFSNVNAQDYRFELTRYDVQAVIEEDGSLTVFYEMDFKNANGAPPIDVVDLGLPSQGYELNKVKATINGNPVPKISYSPYVEGVALELGENQIPAGGTGTVVATVTGITGVLFPYDQDDHENYVNFQFMPNFFHSDYDKSRNTDYTFSIVFPSGVGENDGVYYKPKRWPGEIEPNTFLTDINQLVMYEWKSDKANTHTEYTFGVAFPASAVPASAISTMQDNNKTSDNNIASMIVPILSCILPIAIIVFSIIVYNRSLSKANAAQKLNYLPPTLSVEGHGIKRGLTAVEAGILLQEPLDKILTMILFGLLKKEAVSVVMTDPLVIESAPNLPSDLYDYETEYILAFKQNDKSKQRNSLRLMIIDLVKSVERKMKGFSASETKSYYQSIVDRAWQAVEEAQTPEVKSAQFDHTLEWTMLDKDFSGRATRTFADIPVFLPRWWGRYDPTPSVGGGHMAAPAPKLSGSSSQPIFSLPNLPGATFAASVMDRGSNMAKTIIGKPTDFSGSVRAITNPLPVTSSYSGSSSSSSGGSSCACACACACAGCACACAGGGR